MNLRWNNIFAVLFVILALILASQFGPQTTAALDAIHQVGPSHTPDERLAGFMICGLIGVCIVAIVKILTQQESNRRHHRRDDDEESGEE